MDQESLQRNLMNNDLREFKEQQRTAHVHQENELADVILRLRAIEESLHLDRSDGVRPRRALSWRQAAAHLCCCFGNFGQVGRLGLDEDGRIGRGNRRGFFSERYQQLDVINSRSVVHSHSVQGSENVGRGAGVGGDLEPNENGLTVSDADLRTPLSLRRAYEDDGYADMPARPTPPVAQYV